MEKEESVGQGGKKKKKGHAWSDKIKRLGKKRNREGGKLEPLSQGMARRGEAEPSAREMGSSSSSSGEDAGGAAEPRRPRPRRAAQSPGPAPRPLPATRVPPPVTHGDGTGSAGLSPSVRPLPALYLSL